MKVPIDSKTKKPTFEMPIKGNKDPLFWISEWIPQVEILFHPAVKAGITHCGFGGTLEFIMAGVLLLSTPHVGD